MPAITQGVFYVVTGLWPILHYRSFEAVTGPKVDRWLVKTLGGLITAVGLSLLAGRRDPPRGQRVLGVASAVVLGGSDLIYVGRGRISRVYLGDALAEAAIVALWSRAK